MRASSTRQRRVTGWPANSMSAGATVRMPLLSTCVTVRASLDVIAMPDRLKKRGAPTKRTCVTPSRRLPVGGMGERNRMPWASMVRQAFDEGWPQLCDSVPKRVQREAQAYQRCGEVRYGFVEVACEDCRQARWCRSPAGRLAARQPVRQVR